jgi:hypothetical protein
MQGIQRRQFEMLKRVREFGNTYRNVLTTSPVGQELLTTIGAAIDELMTTDMQKLSASVASRGDRKAAARAALVALLRKGGQLTRALRAEGYAVPPCDLPVSQSDQALLTAGRQLAVEAGRFATEFDGHGMPATTITRVTAAFDAAAGNRGVGRANHVAAVARMRGLLTAAVRQVRRLDLLVANLLADDETALAVWRQARRIHEVRAARASTDDAAAAAAALGDLSAASATPAGDPLGPGVAPLPDGEAHVSPA